MEYFNVSQDETIQNLVTIQAAWIPEEWKLMGKINRSIKLDAADLPPNKNYNFLVHSSARNVYPDLLEQQLPLISTEMKDIFCSYERNIQCNCALLSDKELREQRVYWLFALEQIECIGDGTEFYSNRFLKTLVLDKNKIGNRNIFRIQGIMERKIIVSTNVAESILRRSMTGVHLEKIACADGSL